MDWLLPIGLFWVVAAVQFGGLIDAENGSGLQQFAGLMLTLVVFLALAYGLRLVLGGLGTLGTLVLPTVLPLLVLGWLARITFRLVGVRIVSSRFGADAH